ncbi:MAG: hypothetical protein IJA62_06490 [Ruminococcus sp.]|nr:hypothetical protein [Ruminococcus sp.]
MTKKILSVLLAVVMVLAMGTVALVSVSADLADLPEQPAETYRYYFFMPPEWLNDSTATTGNTAGIYWWEGTGAHGGWPGMAATPADVEGVYYCDVPTDVTTIVWNNFFDGGADTTAPYYADAIQTRNIGTEYYDPDESELYPEGTPNFDGMIYVTDFTIYDFNEYSGKLQFGGEWFYYYGNGEYGTATEKGGSEVYTAYATNNDQPFPKDGPQTETTPAATDAPATTVAPTDAPATTVAPTDAPATTEAPATTVAPTEAPAASTNITFGSETKTALVGDRVTYTIDVTAARYFEDVQANVTYDAEKLQVVRITSDDPNVEDWMVEGPARCPNLDGVIFNASVDGVVKFNAAKVTGFNFTEAKNLVTLEFDVIAAGDANITAVIDEMTIMGGAESYFTAGAPSVTEGITVVESLDVPVPETQPTTAEPTEAPTQAPATAEPTEKVTVPAPATDVTGETEKPATSDEADTPSTGAATYLYIALAMMAMAACAVVVLRKKVNG